LLEQTFGAGMFLSAQLRSQHLWIQEVSAAGLLHFLATSDRLKIENHRYFRESDVNAATNIKHEAMRALNAQRTESGDKTVHERSSSTADHVETRAFELVLQA
jgi:hypothetical protein